MLRFVIDGDSLYVTADQFRTLVDVAVRILRDAAKESGLTFTIGGLRASAPTIDWLPLAEVDMVDVEAEVKRLARRLHHGLTMLEEDEGLPGWMSETTSNALYQAASNFDEGAISGLTFSGDGHTVHLTRQTYRTLDRVLKDQTEALGSVTGPLYTATLTKGPHVNIRDNLHDRAVECYVDRETLRQAGQWIGETVTATGQLRRDHFGRPTRVIGATLERVEGGRQITVADMGGAFEGGPDSVEWLREQRA